MDWIGTKLRVRYQETDQMGVVYHSNYLVWFEVGRTEMIRTIGFSYREMEMKELLLPVLNVSCNYKVSAKYDDEILIKTRISYYNGLKMNFEYQVIREIDQKLLATGETKHVWIDKAYKPVRLEKKEPQIHQLIKSLINKGREV